MNLIKWTGNPFVDCGIAATLSYCQIENVEQIEIKDLERMSDLLMNIYSSEKWSSNLYSIFVNYPINQSAYNLYDVIDKENKNVIEEKLSKQKAEKIADNSYKILKGESEIIKEGLKEAEAMKSLQELLNLEGEGNSEIANYSSIQTYECVANVSATRTKKQLKYKEFLQNLLSDALPTSGFGNCIACGSRNTRTGKNRSHVPLISAGYNFFSFAKSGADFCDVCTFFIQCSPITYFSCDFSENGKMKPGFIVVHSVSTELLNIWADMMTKNVSNQINTKHFTGCFSESYSNAQNALFYVASEIVMKTKRLNDKNTTISLYHFSNFGQTPKLDVYEMPSPVFSFVRKTLLASHNENWKRIVKRGFVFKKKGETKFLNEENVTEDYFKSKDNVVYQDLLNGKPIIKRFFNLWERKVYCKFALLEIYLKEVLFMEEKRIERIKNLADEIAIFVQHSDKGEKRFKELERATQFRFFCSTLQKISKERLELNPEKPLLTCDDFVKEIFPELPFGFSQVRYIILFRLYEQLHDWLKERKGFSDEAENIKEPAKIETVENYGEDYE